MRNKIIVIIACLAAIAGITLLTGYQNIIDPEAAGRVEEESGPKAGDNVPMPSAVPDQVFESSLPLISVETDGQKIPYAKSIKARVYLYDSEDGSNSIADEPVEKILTDFHFRGQSSAVFEKKSYALEFLNENKDATRDVAVLGMAKGHDWVLHGPYMDKALLRNYFSYTIARDTMFYAPDSRLCELYIDGAYEGLYLLVEKPRIMETRINFATNAAADGHTAYLVQRNRAQEIQDYVEEYGERPRQPGPGGIDVDTDYLNTYGNLTGHVASPLYVVYPTTNKITEAQFGYIESDISAFERALYADYFCDETRGYKAYIDMDSFVTYFVLNEFAMNVDTGYFSTYCCRDMEGRLYMGPVWDFNNAYDNYSGTACDPEQGFVMVDNNWFARLCQDKAFVDAVIEKWQELRQGVLADEAMLGLLDEAETAHADAIARNNERWAHTFVRTMLKGGDERNPRTYEEAREKFRSFLVKRGHFLDEHFDRLYANCVN
ncbi:MAG: CotH kinase family protein [Lachnospiraceae bacterium]|nr:CotH kinase family protein [Lachnospiraceae bacterium]